MMLTSKIPAMIAPLTRNIIRKTVKKPPQKIPIHMVGLRILSYVGHMPVSGSLLASWQPANSIGVEVAPVIAPMPAE
jgi:hypothetical protein